MVILSSCLLEHTLIVGNHLGSKIWGRGSLDDKSGLIGVMAAIESLLEKSFEPTRSVVLAFGFDEEASGTYGAQHLGAYMMSVYGKNAFAFIIDEGGTLLPFLYYMRLYSSFLCSWLR